MVNWGEAGTAISLELHDNNFSLAFVILRVSPKTETGFVKGDKCVGTKYAGNLQNNNTYHSTIYIYAL